jgi:elongation factor G
VPPAQGQDLTDPDREVPVVADDNAPFCSLAFKLWSDPYVGKLVFFRVYSGRLKKGDVIYNPRTRKRERVSRVMMIQADKRMDVDRFMRGISRRWLA